ncbi:MAG: hypothetical protein R2939_23170 [Kofleriaceae bacterium]
MEDGHGRPRWITLTAEGWVGDLSGDARDRRAAGAIAAVAVGWTALVVGGAMAGATPALVIGVVTVPLAWWLAISMWRDARTVRRLVVDGGRLRFEVAPPRRAPRAVELALAGCDVGGWTTRGAKGWTSVGVRLTPAGDGAAPLAITLPGGHHSAERAAAEAGRAWVEADLAARARPST